MSKKCGFCRQQEENPRTTWESSNTEATTAFRGSSFLTTKRSSSNGQLVIRYGGLARGIPDIKEIQIPGIGRSVRRGLRHRNPGCRRSQTLQQRCRLFHLPCPRLVQQRNQTSRQQHRLRPFHQRDHRRSLGKRKDTTIAPTHQCRACRQCQLYQVCQVRLLQAVARL